MEEQLESLSLYPKASLLGLPTELRVHIYEYLLQDARLKLRHRLIWRGHVIRNHWALLQINSKIRGEIRETFFTSMTWEFHQGFTEQKLRLWMETIGSESVSQLRHLRLHCKSKCSMYEMTTLGDDYCRREASIDIRPDWGVLGNYSMDGKACSNHASACEKMSSFALINACQKLVTGVDEITMVNIWRAMGQDNSPHWASDD